MTDIVAITQPRQYANFKGVTRFSLSAAVNVWRDRPDRRRCQGSSGRRSLLPRRLLDIPRPAYVATKWWNVGAARPERLRARVIDDETGMWVSEEVERELTGKHVHVIMEPCCVF